LEHELTVGTHGGVEIKGLRELGAALLELPKRVATNTARGATMAASATIRDEARLRAALYVGSVQKGHPPPGTLKRSIIVKRIPEKSGPLLQTMYVHVRSGKRYQNQGKKGLLSQDAYYWPFVEFGTAKMAARPFLRPAFEAKKVAAAVAFEVYLARRIPAEVDKLKIFGLSFK
jgi:HK97 gp10 family phage protein